MKFRSGLADDGWVASVDPVIAVLEAAVAADPNNTSVRVHLAQLLLDAGRADDALAHARAILVIDPVDETALGLASMAAGLSGDPTAESAYARLLAGLRGTAPASPPSAGNPSNSDHPAQGPGGTRTVAFGPDRAHEEEDEDDTDTDDYDGRGGHQSGGPSNQVNPDIERPTVTLADVAGMETVKRRLEMAFLGPMRNAELREAFGTSLQGGLLLYGPPGCGKTFLGRALAGELGASFFTVGLADVLDMWMGASERNMHELFEQARRAAPCVLFLDEVDAIGQKRSQLRHSGGMRNVVAQLLTEMDGVNGANEGVFVLGATNHPWDVDVALRRPGRFDRTVLVLPPDEPARLAIATHHLAKRPCASDLNVGDLAKQTDGFSGADVAHVCDSAAQFALGRSLDSGKIVPIGKHDVREALKGIRSSIGPWFETAENYATFANASGEYDDLLGYLRTRKRR